MKKTTKRLLIVLFGLLGISTVANSQNVIDELTFDAPAKVIRPTGDNINVRENPSPNAPVVTQVRKHQLFGVEEENTGWYKIKDGWISKKVSKVSNGSPILPDMLNKYFGFAEDMDFDVNWRVVSPVGKHGFALCYSKSDNILRLGKQVGNLFVFKYSKVVIFNEDTNADPKKFTWTRKNDPENGLFYEVNAGKNYFTEVLYSGNPERNINLSLFNDKVIEVFFYEKFLDDQEDYFYINSELLSSPYESWW